MELLTTLRRELATVAQRAQNGARHLSGVGHPPATGSPREIVWTRDKVTLSRFDNDHGVGAPPVLLVMSLVTRPHVFDLRPGSSLVERLLERGFDVFLLDWGVPDAVECDNTLETYCDEYLPLAAAQVHRLSGGKTFTVFGYCLGAVLSLLFVAGHRESEVSSLVVLATPIDFSTFGPVAGVLGTGGVRPEDLLDETGNVPAATMLNGIRLLKPTGDLRTAAGLWLNLHDRRYIDAHEALIGWSRDHIPLPGAVFRQMAELFLQQRCLVQGRVPLGDRTVDFGDIRCPVLSVTGELDHLVPPASSDPLAAALPNAAVDELRFRSGHVGLIIGRQAQTRNIPPVLEWMERHSRTPTAATGPRR